MVGKDEEYDLMPHKEIMALKDELKKLKGGPSKSLQNALDKVNNSITDLMSMFKEAGERLNIEEEEEDIFKENMSSLLEKMDVLLDQNQKIAEGVVALAEMMKDVEGRETKILKGIKPRSLPTRPPVGMPPIQGPPVRGPPGPGMQGPPMRGPPGPELKGPSGPAPQSMVPPPGLPPLRPMTPPPTPKKKGLFGFHK